MSPLGEGRTAAADESARTPTPLPAILSALKSIGETFAVTRSLDAVLQEIVESALGLTGGDGASIMLLSPDGRELVVAAATGPRASLILGERQPATASIAGAVVRHGNSSFIRGAATGNEGLESRHPRDLGWGLSLPLRASRQILGVLNISTTVALGDLPPDEVDLLGILANHAAIMIEVGRL
jgi:GAF domain-containing protein